MQNQRKTSVKSRFSGTEDENNPKFVKVTLYIPDWIKNYVEKKAREIGEAESVIYRDLLRKGIRGEEE